ncbi:glycosyl hydrolase 53 domain-containing protein [Planoprotostelium fungivorum]|uniref:Glycosyl hydrolase 53 domain-containing protein n=1 Tax=Planoprotostelium fungivorum TaxID=1890364 RepID=A0A2P6MYR5_9EUKA|nr:glycosyl hydrolase 53 domain-containing protein [Planoprotostelium fungivorum]
MKTFLLLALIATALAAGKRGLPIGSPFQVSTDLKLFETNAISWMYNWGTNSPANSSSIQFIPMQWNDKGIEQLESKVLATCSNYVLGFNEPDLQAQAGMTPAHSCDLWKQYIRPLKEKYGIKLGLPVVTNGGQKWLADFMSLCPDHNADFLPLHWYGQYMGDITWYIGSVHEKYPNLPIWITEYASVSKDANEVVKFAKESMAYLESLPWVERYAWFGTWRTNSDWPVATLTSDGKLSAVGQAYLDTPYNNTVTLTYRCGNKPTTSTVKPTTSTAKPTTSTVKPTTSTVKPTTSTLKPTTSTVKPTTSSVTPTTGVPADAKITITSSSGLNVYVDSDKQLRAEKNQTGTVFLLKWHDQTSMSIVHASSGQFVSAESGGRRPLIANRQSASTWEKFWITRTEGRVSLKSWANGRFVAVQNDGYLLADDTSIAVGSLFSFKYL